jgi:hypothetical protein
MIHGVPGVRKRRLATKGTKSTKGRATDLDLPFVPFVANLLRAVWATA